MAQTVRAVFDGQVLRPEQPLDLRTNAVYEVTIEEIDQNGETADEVYPLSVIRTFATDMGVTDLATHHDWYAHGRIDDEPNDSDP